MKRVKGIGQNVLYYFNIDFAENKQNYKFKQCKFILINCKNNSIYHKYNIQNI